MPTSIDNEKASQLGDATTAAAAAERANAGHHLTLGQFVTRRVLPTVGLLGVAALAAACDEVAVSAAKNTTPTATLPKPDTTPTVTKDKLQQQILASIQKYENGGSKYLASLTQWQKINGQGNLQRPGDFETVNTTGYEMRYMEAFGSFAAVVDVDGTPTIEVFNIVQGADGNQYLFIVNGGNDATDRQSWGGYTFVTPTVDGTYNGSPQVNESYWPTDLQQEADAMNRIFAKNPLVVYSLRGSTVNDYPYNTPQMVALKAHVTQNNAAFDFLAGKPGTQRPASLIPLSSVNSNTLPFLLSSFNANDGFFALNMYGMDPKLSQ